MLRHDSDAPLIIPLGCGIGIVSRIGPLYNLILEAINRHSGVVLCHHEIAQLLQLLENVLTEMAVVN